MEQENKTSSTLSRLHALDIVAAVAIVAGVVLRDAVGPESGERLRVMWPFLKVGLAFLLMVLLVRHKVSVGATLLWSALLMGILFSMSFRKIGEVFSYGVFSGDAALRGYGGKAILFLVTIFSINLLGQLLSERGAFQKMIEAVEGLLRDLRMVTAIIPAAIGLLPMPGGAMLSAPIVGQLGDRLKLSPEKKLLWNYQFRHIWEYWWPLYPAVLIAQDYAPNGVRDIMLRHSPMTFVHILIAWFILVRPLKSHLTINSSGAIQEEGKSGPPPRSFIQNLLALANVLWPIMLVMVLGGIGPRFLPKNLAQWKPFMLPAAVLLTDGIVLLVYHLPRAKTLGAIKRGMSFNILLLVLGVYVIRGIFDKSGVAQNMSDVLLSSAIPAGVPCFIIPFIVGLLTGIVVAGVSVGLPLLAGMVTKDPGLLLLAYVGSYLGVAVSPVHLCLTLTQDYYQATLRKVYPAILLIAGLVLLAAVGLSLCY